MSDDTGASTRQPQRGNGVAPNAWKRTLEDLETIADERRADGWDVLTIKAAQTDTLGRDTGSTDSFGLFHVIPNNHADPFTDTYDDAYTEYLAYGSVIDNHMYLITELIDPDEERSILIAGRYPLARAQGMITAAHDEDILYTHVKTIDGTILGTFEHEEYEPLLPTNQS